MLPEGGREGGREERNKGRKDTCKTFDESEINQQKTI